MLQIKGLTYRVGGRTLFSEASAQITKGQRVGLVGMNGAGKTTLFRIIANALEPDSGNIHFSARTRLGYIAQEAPTGTASLVETVLAADEELSKLESLAKKETDPERISEAHARLADISAHTAPSRAATILDEKADEPLPI